MVSSGALRRMFTCAWALGADTVRARPPYCRANRAPTSLNPAAVGAMPYDNDAIVEVRADVLTLVPSQR